MSFTHTIIHPTDFSESSARAFELACALARDQGARLVVLHVLPPATFHGEVVARRQPEFEDDMWQKLRQVQDPDGQFMTEHRLLSGDPVGEIVRAAEQSGANLIVMGTHGRTGIGRVLMGSVAEHVLRTALCPVMTVRPDLAKTDERGSDSAAQERVPARNQSEQE